MADPWKRKEVIARFEAKCMDLLPSGCRVWLGAVNEHGYGTLSADGMRFKAHRFAWQVAKGPISSETFLLHSCDVPCCVNPDHLRIGTQSENMADAYRRGRRARTNYARGDRQGAAVLLEADVRAIRSLEGSASKAEIARQFGVTRANVSAIIHRKSWAHVD